MLYNSFPFFVFLTILFILYYIPIAQKYQVYVLIVAGIVFFAYSGWYNLLFLLCVVAFNSFFRVMISNCDNTVWRRLLCSFSVIMDVLLLFFVKYSETIMSTIRPESVFFHFVLPIGISFYTFQAISMLVDTYRKVTPKENVTVLNSVLYLTFFPNAVSGPLIRNVDFSAAVSAKRFSEIKWDKIIRFLIVGYFLKVCIADNLQNQTIYVAYPYYLQYSPIQLIIMMLSYSCQLFADFAGYSLIAQGVALMFGYQLPDNFRFPYISKCIGEFWHRWHISLSQWLKNYVYIPLGGNRHGRVRTCVNLFLVMLIGGFWHGSNWKYPIWGSIYGLLLVIERVLRVKDEKVNGIFDFMRTILVFFIVSWLWLFFKLDTLRDVVGYTKALFNQWNIWRSLDLDCCVLSILYCIPILIYHLLYLHENKLKESKIWPYLYYGLYAGMLLLIIMNRGTTNAFVYIQF